MQHGDGSDRGSSLYREIAATLTQRIRDGEYPIGGTLPREIDLGREFGVSRATVREALRLLEAEHAIIRRRRAGTIVSWIDLTAPRRVSFNPASSLQELTHATRLVLHERGRRSVTPGLVEGAAEDAMRDWLYFAGVRRAEAADTPLSITEIFLHPRLEAASHLIGRERTLIYRLVEQACGERMRTVKTRILPCHVTAQQAKLLGVAAGSLGMQLIQRISNDADELLEVAVGTYPAARFAFELSFDLRGQPARRAENAP